MSTQCSEFSADVEARTYEQIWSVSSCSHVLCLAVPSGLDKIYELTNTPTQYELRFDLGLGAEKVYAVYDNFKIAPIKQKFKLTIGKYSGTAGGRFALKIVSKLPALLSDTQMEVVTEKKRGQGWHVDRQGWEYRGFKR